MIVFVFVLALLALLAPSPAHADLDTRVKKLEDELKTIKETSKAILSKLESSSASFFDDLPAKAQSIGRSVYDTVLHHSTKTAGHVQKEYPKWLSFAHEYTKDFPTHATKTLATVQKEGTKHYIHGNKLLANFLAAQGVPQQYIQYITLGVIALVSLVAIVITLSLLSSILGFICRCGKSKRKTDNTQIKKKNDKKAAQQHEQHKQKIAAESKQ